jgi:hypothetical protein
MASLPTTTNTTTTTTCLRSHASQRLRTPLYSPPVLSPVPLQEYEKRLLAKDQEFKLSQEAQERMRRDIARLKQEVARWREEAAAVKYLPAPTTGAWGG